VITSLDNPHKEIIKYLASMMERGLSASSGHSGKCLVVLLSANRTTKVLNLNFPDQRVKKLLTMEECLQIFSDNPKHKIIT
jgi:hypothetical protein